MRRSILPLLPLLAACVGDAPAENAVEVLDSAGVRIVLNPAPDTAVPVFRLSPEPLAAIGVTEGPPEYQLFQVSSGRRLSDGTIVIANRGSFELRFYDAAGTHIRSVGRQGEGPGELQMGMSVVGVLADDSLVVTNTLRRYSIFDREGMFVRSFPLPDSIPSFVPTTVGVLADGRLVVIQPGNVPTGPEDLASLNGIVRRPDVVSTINPDGSFRAHIGSAPGAEVSFKTGPMGPSSAGVVFGRSAHFTAAGNRIVIATNDEYSIPIHDADGRLVQIVRQERVPVAVQEGDFERALPPALRPDAPPPPSPFGARLRAHFETMPRYATLPAFGSGGPGSAVRFDADGTLWVAEYEREFGGARRTWQAFDREGVFLGRLEVPEGFGVFEFGRDWVLGVQRDEMEVERVVLYGLERVTPMQ